MCYNESAHCSYLRSGAEICCSTETDINFCGVCTLCTQSFNWIIGEAFLYSQACIYFILFLFFIQVLELGNFCLYSTVECNLCM